MKNHPRFAYIIRVSAHQFEWSLDFKDITPQNVSDGCRQAARQLQHWAEKNQVSPIRYNEETVWWHTHSERAIETARLFKEELEPPMHHDVQIKLQPIFKDGQPADRPQRAIRDIINERLALYPHSDPVIVVFGDRDELAVRIMEVNHPLRCAALINLYDIVVVQSHICRQMMEGWTPVLRMWEHKVVFTMEYA